MAISSVAHYLEAAKQSIRIFTPTMAVSGELARSWKVFFLPASIGNTANGVVPVDASTVGGFDHPTINAFGAGAMGYLTRVRHIDRGGCLRIRLFDRLFAAGAFGAMSNVALTLQPSFAARVPGGNYIGLELWVEQVTASGMANTVTVDYLNESAVAKQTTISIPSTYVAGSFIQMPLASGDSGVSKITNVQNLLGSVNVDILRPLWDGKPFIGSNAAGSLTMDEGRFSPIEVGFVEVFDTTALFTIMAKDTNAASAFYVDFGVEIANR